MTKNQLKSSIQGALIGFAIGDAMGATTEFMTQEEVIKKYGRVKDIIGGGWLSLRAGEVTDDTQMMTCVARACHYPDDLFTQMCCKEFVEWYRSNPKDVGGACRAAIVEGVGKTPDSWMLASMERQTANKRLDLGNGAAMRALFPALINRPHLAVQQGRLTHNNPTSDSYIRDYCYAVLEAIHFSGVPGGMWDGNYGNLRLMSPTGHVENSVKNAIYWSFNSKNFREAILGPVNHGGDADTIAALTGGIAGAYWGLENIPQRWVEQLNPETKRELLSLADWALTQWGGKKNL